MATFRSHARAAVALAAIMLLGFTDGAKAIEFAGGTGEPNNPYQIATADQLIAIGSDPNLLDKYFVLVADIDMAAWRQVGAVIARITAYVECRGAVGPLFEGTFDGQRYTIRNLTLRGLDGTSCTALFGQLGTHARVSGVRLVDISIQVGNSTSDVGGLAGRNKGVIRDCRVRGSLSAGQWTNGIGGLVGSNGGIIVNSAISITAQAGSNSSVLSNPDAAPYVGTSSEFGAESVGGLVGTNSGTVAYCAASAMITTAYISTYVGGLAGQNDGLICNCSAAGAVVAGNGSHWVGGLLGVNEDYYGSVVNCLSTASVSASGTAKFIGGLIGSGARGVSGCYFLALSEGGGPDNEIGTALADSQMRQQASYTGWDFLGQRRDGTSEVWMMPSEGGYPALSILQGYEPAALSGSGTGDDPFLIETAEQLGAAAYRPDALLPAGRRHGCVRNHLVLGCDPRACGLARRRGAPDRASVRELLGPRRSGGADPSRCPRHRPGSGRGDIHRPSILPLHRCSGRQERRPRSRVSCDREL